MLMASVNDGPAGSLAVDRRSIIDPGILQPAQLPHNHPAPYIARDPGLSKPFLYGPGALAVEPNL